MTIESVSCSILAMAPAERRHGSPIPLGSAPPPSIGPDDGAYDVSLYMACGMRVSAYPWGVWYSRNITSDEETGIGRWTEDELVRAVTRGIAKDGRRLHPMAMSWPWFTRLTESDARAIAVYLKRLPAIRNPVPLPEPVPLAEAAGGGLVHVFGAEVALEFWGGNAATDPSLRGDLAAPPDGGPWRWCWDGACLHCPPWPSPWACADAAGGPGSPGRASASLAGICWPSGRLSSS